MIPGVAYNQGGIGTVLTHGGFKARQEGRVAVAEADSADGSHGATTIFWYAIHQLVRMDCCAAGSKMTPRQTLLWR